MVLNDVLEILQNDAELSELLKPTANDSKIYAYRGQADTCIAYRLTPVSSDGIKAQDKLEINCISTDYATAENILSRVKDLILTVGDEKLNDEILTVSLNGGGILFDEKTEQHILKAYFVLVTKERMLK